MPIYNVGSKSYNIPEDKINAFLSRYPDANLIESNNSSNSTSNLKTTKYVANGNVYKLPNDKVDAFLLRYPDAELLEEDQKQEQESFMDGSVEQQEKLTEPLNQPTTKIDNPLFPTPLVLDKPESTIGLDALRFKDKDLVDDKTKADSDRKPLEVSDENMPIFKASWNITREKNRDIAKNLIANNASFIDDNESGLVSQLEEKFGFLNSKDREDLTKELKGIDFSKKYSMPMLLGNSLVSGALERYFPSALGKEFDEQYAKEYAQNKDYKAPLSQEQKDILKRANLYKDYPEARNRAVERQLDWDSEQKAIDGIALILSSKDKSKFKDLNTASIEVAEKYPNLLNTVKPFLDKEKAKLVSTLDSEFSKIEDITKYSDMQTSGLMTSEDQLRPIISTEKVTPYLKYLYKTVTGTEYDDNLWIFDSHKQVMTEIKNYTLNQLDNKLLAHQQVEKAKKYPEYKVLEDKSKADFNSKFEGWSESYIKLKDEANKASTEIASNYEEEVNLKVKDLNSNYELYTSKIGEEYQSGKLSRVDYEKLFSKAKDTYINKFDSIQDELSPKYDSILQQSNKAIADKYASEIDKELKEFNKTYETPREISNKINNLIKQAGVQLNQELISAREEKFGVTPLYNGFLLAGESYKSFVNSIGRTTQAYGTVTQSEALYNAGRYLSTMYSIPTKESIEDLNGAEYFKSLLDPINAAESFGNLLGSAAIGIGASMAAVPVGARAGKAIAGSRGAVVGGLVSGAIAGFSAETLDMVNQVKTEALNQGLSSLEADRRGSEMFNAQLSNSYMYALDGLPFVSKAMDFIPKRSLRVAGAAIVEGITETGQELVQTAQEGQIGKTGYVSGWDVEYKNALSAGKFLQNKMVKETLREVLPGSILMGGGMSAISQASEVRNQKKVTSEAYAILSANTEEFSPSIMSQKILRSVQQNGKVFTKGWVASLANMEGVSRESVNKLLVEVDDAATFASNNKNLTSLEQLVYRTLQSQYLKYDEDANNAGASGSEDRNKIIEKRNEIKKQLDSFVADPKTGGSYAIVSIKGESPIVMSKSQLNEFLSNDENAKSVFDSDDDSIKISASKSLVNDYKLDSDKRKKYLDKIKSASDEYKAISDKIEAQAIAKEKQDFVTEAAEEAAAPSITSLQLIDIAEEIDSIESEMNNAEFINDSRIDAVLETILNKVEDINSSETLSDNLKFKVINSLYEVAEKLDNYEFRTKNVSAGSVSQRTSDAIKEAKGKESAKKRFDKTEVTINGSKGFTITSIGDGLVALSSTDKSYGKVTSVSFPEDFLYVDEDGNFSALVMIDEDGNELVITDENVGVPIALEQLERFTEDVSTEDMTEEVNYIKELRKVDPTKETESKKDVKPIEKSKETESKKDEVKSTISEDIKPSKETEDVIRVSPTEGVSFEYESKKDIPIELQGVQPISESEITIGGDKKIRLTFSGQQLIDSGLAKPKETESKKDEKRSETKDDAKPKAGNRLFNEPLKEVKAIADEYYERVFGKKRKSFNGTRELDVDRAKRISDAFEAMVNDPNNKEVSEAYKQLAKEVIAQFEAFIDAGYTVEINNTEAYSNSEEMIEDLRANKRIKIFSTESGYGDKAITDAQRKENPLLAVSKFVDINGEPLLVNDLFRAVHDFFGHAELGNSFGVKGEENAWNVHARMFSPLARRAMTTETRGQNSYVNFSGVNDKVEALRDKARKLRSDGASESDIQAVVDEIYELTSFAEQKVGLLPEEFSVLDEEVSFDYLLTKEEKSQLENARRAVESILPELEIIVSESEEKYKESTKEVKDESSGGTFMIDPQSREMKIYINPNRINKRTIAHEVFHAILFSNGRSNSQVFDLTNKMISAVDRVSSKELKDRLKAFATGYSLSTQNEEKMAELFGILAEEYLGLDSKSKSVIRRWLDKLIKALGIEKLFKGKASVLEDSDDSIISLLKALVKKVAKGEVIEQSDIDVFQNILLEGVSQQDLDTEVSKIQKNDKESIEFISKNYINKFSEKLAKKILNNKERYKDLLSSSGDSFSDISTYISQNVKSFVDKGVMNIDSKYKDIVRAIKNISRKVKISIAALLIIGSTSTAKVNLSNDMMSHLNYISNELESLPGYAEVALHRMGLYAPKEFSVEKNLEKVTKVIKVDDKEVVTLPKSGQLKVVKEERWNKGDISIHSVYFNNDTGMVYYPVPAKGNRTAPSKVKGDAIAHFFVVDGISKFDGYKDIYDATQSDLIKMSNWFKSKPNFKNSNNESWHPVFQKNKDNTVLVKYKKKKDITQSDAVIQRLVQFKYNDIDWANDKRVEKVSQYGGINNSSNTFTLRWKNSQKEMSSVVFSSRGLYSQFSGAAGIFIGQGIDGKTYVKDFSGSVNSMLEGLDVFSKSIGANKNDITFGFYDAGSVTAKPSGKDGMLDRKTWNDYNPKPFAGSGLAIDFNRQQKSNDFTMSGVVKESKATRNQGKSVESPISLISRRQVGAFDVQYTEQNRLEELIKGGKVVEVDDMSLFSEVSTAITSPDDMLAGTISIDGVQIFEGGGGVFFVTKYGDVWASGNKETADKLKTAINLSLKENGNNKGYLVLAKGSDSKLISSVSGVNSSLAVLKSMLDNNLLTAEGFRSATVKGIEDFKLKASKKAVLKIKSDKIKEEAEIKKGSKLTEKEIKSLKKPSASNVEIDNYLKKNFSDKIKLTPDGSADVFIKELNSYFENPKTTTFQMRGDVLRSIIGRIAIGLPKDIKPSLNEFLGGDKSKNIGVGSTEKSQALVDLITGVASEKLTKGLAVGDVYAVIEVDGKVETFEDSHPSYPWHVRLVNGGSPKLYLPKNRENGSNLLKTKSNKKYTVTQVSVMGGRFNNTKVTRKQKVARDKTWEDNAKKSLPESRFRSEMLFKDAIESGKWALLTAENPEAKSVSEDENKKLNKKAVSWLEKYGYKPTVIFGKYGNPENSFYVESMDRADAAAFAREFEQESVATNEGLVYKNGSMNPRKIGGESFNVKEDDNYSVININGENVSFKIDYEYNTIESVIPKNVQSRLLDDGDGNYVFYHYSDEARDVLIPKSGDGRVFTSKEEVAALSSIGGGVMFYVDENTRESGVGNVKHTVRIPKEKVYYLQKDFAGFFQEAKDAFLKVRPGQGFSSNYQAAWISKVMEDNGYEMLVSEWTKGANKLRAQRKSEIVPEESSRLVKRKQSSNITTKDVRKLFVEDKLNRVQVREYLNNSGMSFFQIKKLLDKYGEEYRKEDAVFTRESGNKLINGLENIRRNTLSNKAFKPKSFQIESEYKDGAIEHHAKETELNARKLLKAIDKSGLSGVSLDELIKNIDLHLRGKGFDENGDSIIKDEAVLSAVQGMRAHLDFLSEMLVDSGLVKAEDSNLNIIENLGSYLNRSFQAFDDKKWVENNVTDSMIKNAKLRLTSDIRNKSITSKYIESLRSSIESSVEKKSGAGYMDRLEIVVNNEIERLLSGKEGSEVFAFTKEGSVDSSPLMQRNDIPKEIRELLGEYVDPLLNYTRTAYKISSILAEKQYLRNLVASGEGVWLFKEDDTNRPKEFNTLLVKPGEKGRSDLAGYLTTKEIAAEFNGGLIISSMANNFSGLYKGVVSAYAGYLKAVGSIKYTKTILSVGTHGKNVIGNTHFMAQNGYLSPEAYVEAFSVVKESFGSKATEMSSLYSDVIKSGLINQGQMRELKSMFSDQNSFQSAIAKIQNKRNETINRGIKKLALKGKEGVFRASDLMQKAYQVEDDFFKIVAFQIERERYAQSLYGSKFNELNQTQKDDVLSRVTEIVKNILPNYSRLGNLAKLMKAIPVAGTFISFEMESYRTAWNTVAIAIEEVKDPRTASIGVKRLASMSITNAIKYAGVSMFGSALIGGLKGDDDEESWLESKYKYIRDYVQPWSKNSQIALIEVSDGKAVYLDFSASDPQGSLYEVINASRLSDNPKDAFLNGLKQLMSPYMTEDILLGTIVDIKESIGEDDSLMDVINESIPKIVKVMKPGTVSSVEKIYESESAGIELLGQFTGYKPIIIDVEKSFGVFKIRDIKKRLNDNRKDYVKVAYNFKDGTATEGELEAAYNRVSEKQQEILLEATRLYNGAIHLTADEKVAKSAVKEVISNKSITNQIISGDYIPMKRNDLDPKSKIKSPAGRSNVKERAVSSRSIDSKIASEKSVTSRPIK